MTQTTTPADTSLARLAALRPAGYAAVVLALILGAVAYLSAPTPAAQQARVQALADQLARQLQQRQDITLEAASNNARFDAVMQAPAIQALFGDCVKHNEGVAAISLTHNNGHPLRPRPAGAVPTPEPGHRAIAYVLDQGTPVAAVLVIMKDEGVVATVRDWAARSIETVSAGLDI